LEKDQVSRPDMRLLVIGGSAGSLEVVLTMLPRLEVPLKIAIVVIMHRKFTADASLSKLFRFKTEVPVTEVEDKQRLLPGTIHIAPVDYHLLFEQDGTLSLDVSEKVQFSRPSIDVSFESAADVYGEDLICLLLSGANADGVHGLAEAKAMGAKVIVQSPGSAAFPVMPEMAVSQIRPDRIIEPSELADFINALE
jgi:two-component system, chemotaxis family, protein-glutamate methylesterase/glutaminase